MDVETHHAPVDQPKDTYTYSMPMPDNPADPPISSHVEDSNPAPDLPTLVQPPPPETLPEPTDLVSPPTLTIEPPPPPVSGYSPTPPGRPQRVKKPNVRLNPEEWELGQLSDTPGQNQISTMELLLELVRRMYEGSKGGPGGGGDK